MFDIDTSTPVDTDTSGILTSRKLAAVISGIAGLLGLGAYQVFGGTQLSNQQFNILAVGIVTLSGGGTLVQGAIDYIKAKV